MGKAEIVTLAAQGVSKGRDERTRKLMMGAGAKLLSSGYSLLDGQRNMLWEMDEFDPDELAAELTALGWEWGTYAAPLEL